MTLVKEANVVKQAEMEWPNQDLNGTARTFCILLFYVLSKAWLIVPGSRFPHDVFINDSEASQISPSQSS